MSGSLFTSRGTPGSVKLWESPRHSRGFTCFNYYGYRYYDPKDGRWLGRDPIEEEGGLNVFNMLENDNFSKIDILGLVEIKELCTIQMLLGHSTSMNSINSLKEEDLNLLEEEIAKQFAEAANAAKKADRVSCISCFRDRTNSNLPADKQVPSTPGNERKSNLIYPTKDGKEKNGRKGIDETVGEAYKKELENARQGIFGDFSG